jgi:predicted MFS family arabinose efflux permease
MLCIWAIDLGLGFGLVERSVPLRMTQYGLSTDNAGLFIAVLAAGSVLGGIYVSRRPVVSPRPVRIASVLFFLFGVCVLPSAFAPSAPVFLLTLLMASLMLVPLVGLGTAEIEARLSRGSRAEGFAYFLAAVQVGAGIAGVACGIMADFVGVWAVALVAAGIFWLAAAWLLAWSRPSENLRKTMQQ